LIVLKFKARLFIIAEGITGATVNTHGIYQIKQNPLGDNSMYARIQSSQ